MKLDAFPLLADENIHPDVVRELRAKGANVLTAADCGLSGHTDTTILCQAHAQHRVVLTHDKDFAALAIVKGSSYRGILFLRPGHILPKFTMESIETAYRQMSMPEEPFIVVVQRQANSIRIRVKQGVKE